MSTITRRHTVDEYFEAETASERHEYVDGEILQMVGGSTPHNGRWKSERFSGVNNAMRLESLGWDLSLAELYADIDFTAQ